MASDGRIVHEPLARVLDVGCGNGSLLFAPNGMCMLSTGIQWIDHRLMVDRWRTPVRSWGPRRWPCLREDGAVAAGRQA